MRQASGRWARRAFRLLLVISAMTPLGLAIFKEWLNFRSSIAGLHMGPLLLAQLILILLMPLMGLTAWITLRGLGSRLPLIKVSALFFLSQAPKYLPGGIWAFPGRMVAYQSVGVERKQSVVSVIRETSVVFLGAAMVGGLGLVQGLQLPSEVRLVIGLGVLASVVVISSLQVPWLWRRLSSWKLLQGEYLRRYFREEIRQWGFSWLPGALASSVAFWILLGFPFRLLALAIHPDLAALSSVEAASIFTLAWCAGFVIVFVPAGLGIRESALSLLLSGFMPIGEALSLALIARLWWMLGEAVWILTGVLWAAGSGEVSWRKLLRREQDEGERRPIALVEPEP